jgi:hypothetical protein
MTMATFEVLTGGGPPETDVSLTGAAQLNRQIDLQVWTAVTAPVPPDRPSGTPTLIVLPGLRRALSVRVYQTAEDVAVEDPATGIFGAGASLPGAVEDFQDALRDHLAILAEEDALAPALQRQLDTLRGYFSTP